MPASSRMTPTTSSRERRAADGEQHERRGDDQQAKSDRRPRCAFIGESPDERSRRRPHDPDETEGARDRAPIVQRWQLETKRESRPECAEREEVECADEPSIAHDPLCARDSDERTHERAIGNSDARRFARKPSREDDRQDHHQHRGEGEHRAPTGHGADRARDHTRRENSDQQSAHHAPDDTSAAARLDQSRRERNDELRDDGRRADRKARDAEPDDVLRDGGRGQGRGDTPEQDDDQLASLDDVAERDEE